MDYGNAAHARMATLRATGTLRTVHPTLIQIVNRHLAGDTAASREMILGLRVRGDAEAVGAFAWKLACMITICQQGTVTPDPAVPYDRDACEFINLAAPLAEGTPMPLLQTSLAQALLDRKWFVAGDADFAGLVERVMAHAARWPEQLVSVMAGGHAGPQS